MGYYLSGRHVFDILMDIMPPSVGLDGGKHHTVETTQTALSHRQIFHIETNVLLPVGIEFEMRKSYVMNPNLYTVREA